MIRRASWRICIAPFLLACVPASGDQTAINAPLNAVPAPSFNLAWPFFAPELNRGPRHIQVGPTRTIKLPSEAAEIAQTGDIIEIDAETYVGDTATWLADNLTIRGAGGRARLLAAGKSAEAKAIWVIKGRNAIVHDIEFAGASVPPTVSGFCPPSNMFIRPGRAPVSATLPIDIGAYQHGNRGRSEPVSVRRYTP